MLSCHCSRGAALTWYRRLAAKWRENPSFLRPELGAWMQKAQAPALERSWGQLLQESGAIAGAQQR